jgi:hypothetical protein
MGCGDPAKWRLSLPTASRKFHTDKEVHAAAVVPFSSNYLGGSLTKVDDPLLFSYYIA